MKDSENTSGVYIVFVDGSDEFQSALKLACELAGRHQGHVMLVKALEPIDFQQWGTVEDRLLAEQRKEAEQMVINAACDVMDINGTRPSVCIEEGVASSVLSSVMETDERIEGVVLAASKNTVNPLVTHFSNKGFANLNVPLFIVPERD